MWGLETIIAMNNKRAEEVEMLGGQDPYHLTSLEQLENFPPYPFPNVGSYSDNYDKEYKRVDSLFVDSSGFGSEGEPALTQTEFKAKLEELLEEYSESGGIYLAIESEGQFQVHIGVWID